MSKQLHACCLRCATDVCLRCATQTSFCVVLAQSVCVVQPKSVCAVLAQSVCVVLPKSVWRCTCNRRLFALCYRRLFALWEFWQRSHAIGTLLFQGRAGSSTSTVSLCLTTLSQNLVNAVSVLCFSMVSNVSSAAA